MSGTSGGAAPSGSRYVDQRTYVVARSLDLLRGPTRGVVTLDRRLDWSGRAQYDLDNPRRLASMYENVLREASSEDDLASWLDAATLLRLWADLILPPQVRSIWETKFPQLSAARRRAA